MDTYEKKYKEIVGKIRKAYLYAQTDSTKAVLKEILPELGESEDERIINIFRKVIYGCNKGEMQMLGDKERDDCLAWLEKQCQVKESHISQHENRTCEENDDSLTCEDGKIRKDVLSFFRRKGQHIDKYKWHKWIAWLEKQGSKDKFIEKELGCIKGYREKAIKRLEELEKQDEKDILKDAILDGYILDDDKDGLIAETIRYKNEKQSEQKFEMKTAEESLGIESDTCNKIVDECIFGEQKPVEENKGNIGGISPNWSEEDKDFMYDTLSNLTELKDRYGEGYGNVGKCIDWLKSLRPQNRWKPSEEQMQALWLYAKQNNYYGAVLTPLYKYLKKLKEGKV